MDKRRAKQIASSAIMANVTYNGTAIYIESINDNKETAYIHPLNQPKNRQEVSLSTLSEY